MEIKKIILCGLFVSTSLIAYEPENKPNNSWSIYTTPTLSNPNSIGSYANGCLAGATSLASEGNGFYDMRRNRNRHYGHPRLINFISELGHYTDKKYKKRHLIGDLSQARGGPMNFGHSSHQIGLDVDIWMQTIDKGSKTSNKRDMKTIVNKASGRVINNNISPVIRDALYFTSNHRDVARVFVNPVVKQRLCQTETNREWLGKIRPWWGHDQHFHVRLNCPANDFSCKNQNPVPEGSGCNDGLYNWVDDQSDAIINPKPIKKTKNKSKRYKKQPELCNSLQF